MALGAGRLGPGRRCGKLGQVVQRVGEMLRAERRELDAPLPDVLRHRRPVVGERDLSLGRTERRKVVTPEPAAELQLAVGERPPLQQVLNGPSDDPFGSLNLVGGLRRSMAKAGYCDLKEFQKVGLTVGC